MDDDKGRVSDSEENSPMHHRGISPSNSPSDDPKISSGVSSDGISKAEALTAPATNREEDQNSSNRLKPIQRLEDRWGKAGNTIEPWHALATAFLYLLLYRVSTLLPYKVTSTVFVTLSGLVLVLVFTVRLARAIRNDLLLALNFGISLLFAGPLILLPIFFRQFPTWQGWARVGPIYGHYYQTLKHVVGVKELIIIWLAVSIGVGISRLIREFKLLLPIAVVLAAVDIFTVLGGGVVEQAVKGTNSVAIAAMNALTVQLPSTKSSAGSAPIQLFVGFADYLFIALFFACFQRFGVRAWRTFVILTTTLVLYMVTVFYTGMPLPALVPIAVVVVSMNFRLFRYTREEATALTVAGILVAAILALFYWAGHH